MFNKGDIVVCRENDNGGLSITVGKEYTVISASKFHVQITNDNGVTQGYLVERFQAPSAQIKLEVGKTYITAGDYVVNITTMLAATDEYFATVETSPGVNNYGNTIQRVNIDRIGDFRRYGWSYRPDGTINLGNEWSEKLRIVKEFPKLKPAPKGFRYKNGFPQARSPKKGDWYMCCMSGDAIEASNDESKGIVRVILEKEIPKMSPCPETYPKYYETSDRSNYAYRLRTSENEYCVVDYDGTLGRICEWDRRGHIIDDIELNKDVALGRIKKQVAQTPAPPKITNLRAEVASVATPAPKQSMLSYWIAEPIGNMFGAAKKSARYVVASSLLAGVGYVSFNPLETFKFVSSCIPKVHIKFGAESPESSSIDDINVGLGIPVEKQ